MDIEKQRDVDDQKTVVFGLKFGVTNVRSLGSRLDCVIDHANENKLDVVALTETWLSNVEKKTILLWLILAWSKTIPYIIVRDLTAEEEGVSVYCSATE